VKTTVALVLAVVFAFAGVAPATAQGIEITSSTARNQFPDGSSSPSTSGATTYRRSSSLHHPPGGQCLRSRNARWAGRPAFTLKSNPKLFLVPGANVIYYWEEEDADGRSQMRSHPSTRTTASTGPASRGQARALVLRRRVRRAHVLDVGNAGMSRMENWSAQSSTFGKGLPLRVGGDSTGRLQAGRHGVITLGECSSQHHRCGGGRCRR
jgi:hypothetical protein